MSARAEAEELLNATFVQALNRWGTINRFRQIVPIGLRDGATIIGAEREAGLRAILANPRWASVLRNRGVSASEFGRTVGQQTVETAAVAADAASIIFAHALLDDLALQCCRITMVVDPEGWLPDLASRQVSMDQAWQQDRADLLRGLLDRHLQELEQGSLLKKFDRVFARCQPEAGWTPFTDGTVYDRDRLVAFDSLRHDLVHRPTLQVPTGNVEDELWYFLRLPLFLLHMISHRYGLGALPGTASEVLQ